MNTFPMVSSGPANYELRYESLFNAGHAYAFPCDAEGHVDLEALSERARKNYLYVCTVVGREFSMPMLVVRAPR
jgi:hypothetical protein